MCHKRGFAGMAEPGAQCLAMGWQEGPSSPGKAGAASVPVDCCNAAPFAYETPSSWLLLSKEHFSKRLMLFVLSF